LAERWRELTGKRLLEPARPCRVPRSQRSGDDGEGGDHCGNGGPVLKTSTPSPRRLHSISMVGPT